MFPSWFLAGFAWGAALALGVWIIAAAVRRHPAPPAPEQLEPPRSMLQVIEQLRQCEDFLYIGGYHGQVLELHDLAAELERERGLTWGRSHAGVPDQRGPA